MGEQSSTVAIPRVVRAMRLGLAYAADRAEMAVAFGTEADAHYRIFDRPRAVDLRRYARGYLAGPLARKDGQDVYRQPVFARGQAARVKQFTVRVCFR